MLTSLLVAAIVLPTEMLQAVEQHVATEAAARYPAATVQVALNRLDPRLKISPCEDFDLQLQAGRLAPRFAAAIRCNDARPWTIYVTGQTRISLPVVVTTAALGRGEQVGQDQVRLVERDIAGLNDRYLTKPSAVVGQLMKRHLAANAVVLPEHLAPATLIAKGDRVMIRAGKNGITVTAQGHALQSGIKGAQIAVKNVKSKRTIYAYVVDAGLVSTQAARPSGQRPGEAFDTARLDSAAGVGSP